MNKLIQLLFFMSVIAGAAAADLPYNENADAKADIKQALATAGEKIRIIVVFGANWCPDCRELDLAMKRGATAALLAKYFKIVKVDVGHFDKNLDLAKSYGVPVKKGIPAVAVISSNNKLLGVTKEGELADARKMGDEGIYKFFKHVEALTELYQ
jgi:protein disulfide-isomerase